jgi:hypothetical protein
MINNIKIYKYHYILLFNIIIFKLTAKNYYIK